MLNLWFNVEKFCGLLPNIFVGYLSYQIVITCLKYLSCVELGKFSFLMNVKLDGIRKINDQTLIVPIGRKKQSHIQI